MQRQYSVILDYAKTDCLKKNNNNKKDKETKPQHCPQQQHTHTNWEIVKSTETLSESRTPGIVKRGSLYQSTLHRASLDFIFGFYFS